MNRILPPLKFILCLVCCLPLLLRAQHSSREEFSLLLDEAILLQNTQPLSGDQFALIDSARQYADSEMYDLAVIFLEQFLDNHSLFQKTAYNSTSNMMTSFSGYDLFVRTGVDYNRQEFEVGYFQADSVLIDQVQKPYIAISYSQPLWSGNVQTTSMLIDARYDKENMTVRTKLESAVITNNFEGRFNLGFEFDKNALYPDLGYQEANTRQFFRWQLTNNIVWRLDNSLRYKVYQAPSVSVPDFLRDQLNTGLTYWTKSLGSYTLNYNLDFNESMQVANNDYRMHTFDIVMGNSAPATVNYSVNLSYRNNRFSYTVSDSVFRNNSQSVFADISFSLNFSPVFRLKALYRPKYKTYRIKTEQEPDYSYHELSSYLGFDLSNQFSLQTGYLFEKKMHREFAGSQSQYIKEQNYSGHGVAFGADYSTLTGMYISLSGSYVWRRYPDAIDVDIFRIYSNKNILSLLLMLQIPITDHIELNSFVSYDNDQDLDTDENNTRSSFFSAEIVYKF